ncbi:MAG: energy transducer TonB [Pyrinomonadaceae bacterium]
MKALVASLLLFVQAGQVPDKWECRNGLEPMSREQMKWVKPAKLKERIVSCSIPRLPPTYDAQGTVLFEVQIDESGNIRCARPLAGGTSVMRSAALEAAMKWRFKPLVVGGKAQPFRSVLWVLVHWDRSEAAKQCPQDKQRA